MPTAKGHRGGNDRQSSRVTFYLEYFDRLSKRPPCPHSKAPQDAVSSVLQLFRQEMRRSITAREGYALIDLAEGEAGRFDIRVLTNTGLEQFRGVRHSLHADPQSGAVGRSPTYTSVREAYAALEQQPSAAALWSSAKDSSREPRERVEAIYQLLESGVEGVAPYMADELAKDDQDHGWLSSLVFLAEDIHFPASLHQTVGERLMQIAARLRHSAKGGTDKLVYSALRRAVTLLPKDPARLLPFVGLEGEVDTRSVALRCIQRMFELSPPDDAPHAQTADRIFNLGMKFVDRDVFTGGEPALIVQTAAGALAALGDLRLTQMLQSIAALNRGWMNHQLGGALEGIMGSWKMSAPEATSHPAYKNIEIGLATLK